MFQAGFASCCITPQPGLEIPGLFQRRIAQGVHDDLYARAAVIDDGVQVIAIVQTDAIKVSEDLVAAARRQIRRLCGIPAANCFIAATHTHSGGPIFAGFASEPDPDYARFVAQQIAAAVAEAGRRRRPARVGADATQAEGFAFNRRFRMKDGTEKTHPGKMNPDIVAPAGPADPAVTVIALADPKTHAPFGCLVHFACHATHMNGYLFSADYVRWIVDTLRAVHGPGFGVVFLNGACGDVTQVDNQSPRPGEFGSYWCQRTGRGIAGAAITALARTDYYAEASIATAAARVRASVRRSTPEERRDARRRLEKKPNATDPETTYARECLAVEKMRRKRPVRSLEIMGVRIADAFLWGVPGEFFQAFAQDLKQDSSFPNTCCVELANGYNGYICTPDAFNRGGYEIRTARSSFLEPDTGPRIVTAAKRLARRMFDDAESEIRRLPNRRAWPKHTDEDVLEGASQ